MKPINSRDAGSVRDARGVTLASVFEEKLPVCTEASGVPVIGSVLRSLLRFITIVRKFILIRTMQSEF
jgi:hypothetical protein